MRVAIIHYWLVNRRGGERVLEEIAALYPQADIFTHVLDRNTLGPPLKSRAIQETAIARLPFARRAYKAYFGLMPRALEALDLSAYDLVISSESGPAQGVIVPPHARHITYCHSPMRYIWDQFSTYRRGLPAPARPVFDHVAHRMRLWDAAAAKRVDRIVANSAFVAGRVRRFWGREASVIHPPVDLSRFTPRQENDGAAPYLFVSELTGYKRADLVIEAFCTLERELIIVGDGPDRQRLEAAAPSNVSFKGRLSDTDLAAAYAAARALIFPAEEDFGLVPVEAMAAGRPVIAFGRGGATESVIDGQTGLFFNEQTPEAIRAAITRFEARAWSVSACRARAEDFSTNTFRAAFKSEVDALMAAPPESAKR